MKLDDVPQALLHLLDLHHGGHVGEWRDPQPIARPLPPVMAFDEALLPEVLRRRARDVAHRMQCPIDFVAIPMMVMYGSLIGTGVGIRPKQKDDWYEYPNLWGGIVARPGALKSPAISEALAPLRRVERRANDDHAAELTRFQIEEAERKWELEGLSKRKGGALTSDDKARVLELSKKLEPPKARRFHTQDATVEKLGELIRDNERGLLVHRDELVGLLAQLDREGQQGSRAFYLEGWNGKHSFQTDRIARGSVYIPLHCLTLLGGIQPAKLQGYLYDGHSTQNDGLLQRFQVLVYPDELRDVRVVDERRDEDALSQSERIAEQIAYGDFAAFGASSEERNGRITLYYQFDSTAQAHFLEWLGRLVEKVKSEEVPIMAEHLNKYRKLVPGLALITHVIEIVSGRQPPGPIPFGTLEMALRWADYLDSHARRIYGISTDYELLAAEALARALSAGTLEDGFSERDVYRHGWTYLNDPELARAACRELCEAGWLRREQADPTPGRPQSPRYIINPKVKGP